MDEIDLGAIRVALTPVPTGVPSDAPQEVHVKQVASKGDASLRDLSKPAYLPAGLAFSNASVITGPVEIIVATFTDSTTGKSVTLAQMPVSGLKAPDGGKGTVYAVGEDLEEVEVAGRRAARVTVSRDPGWRGARTGLVWLGGANVFQLSGRGTSEAELLEVAASV
jgi:hypothetical protein